MNLNWRHLCFHFTYLKFSLCWIDGYIHCEIWSRFCLERFPQTGRQVQEWSRGTEQESACIRFSAGTANSSQRVSSPGKWHNVPLAEETVVRSFQVSLLNCWIANRRELNFLLKLPQPWEWFCSCFHISVSQSVGLTCSVYSHLWAETQSREFPPDALGGTLGSCEQWGQLQKCLSSPSHKVP